jgi:hypothetical protein
MVWHNLYCDGLSRIMEAAWRSLGMRAEKLYRSGHTQADLFWEDADGVFRGHLFDVSEGWFVYDRSGTYIATADDIAGDYSLIFRPSSTPVPAQPHYWGMYNWVHAPHIAMPEYRPHLDLRKNESLTLHWGNVSLPYLDNFKRQGKNVITVNGEVSGNGALYVTWNWDDTMGEGREHVYMQLPLIMTCDKLYHKGEDNMQANKIKMEIRPEILIQAVMNMKKKERDSFLEDLLATTSPDYLKSIKESRDDYQSGRVKSHDDIFGE